MTNSNNIIIRPATPDDAERLAAIYAPYVTDTAITFEYVAPTVEEFRGRIVNTLRKYPYLVAEADGQLLGYAYASAFKGRAAYDWAVETSIYLRQGESGRGLGRLLHDALQEKLQEMGILNMCACITAPRGEDPYVTENSIQFHDHLGYRMVGRFVQCGYKFGRWYDMVWMEKHIGPHPDQVEPVRFGLQAGGASTPKKSLIVYGSRYGTTKRYAERLSAETGIQAVDYQEVKTLEDYDRILYMGSLYAGQVTGLKKTVGKLLPQQELVVVTVGLVDTADAENIARIRRGLKELIPAANYDEKRVFHLRGAIDYSRMKVKHRLMMSVVHAKIAKMPEAERNAECRVIFDTYGKTVDYVDFGALKPIVEAIKTGLFI